MSLRPCILKLRSWILFSGRNPNTLLPRYQQSSPLGLIASRNLIVVARDRDIGVAKQLKDTRAKIDGAVASQNADDLRLALIELRKLVTRLPHASNAENLDSYLSLTPSKVAEMTRIYLRTGREADAVSASHLLYDCLNLYGVPINSAALSAALYALVGTRQTKRACGLLHSVSRSPNFRSGAVHWQIVLGGYTALGYVGKIMQLIAQMKATGPFPNQVHYRLLLIAMSRDSNVSSQQVKEIIDEMHHYRIRFDLATHDVLSRKGQGDEGWRLLAEEYHMRHKDSPIPAEQVQAWTRELVETLNSKGRKAFEMHLLRLRHKGYFCNEGTLRIVLEQAGATSVDILMFLQMIMDVEGTPKAWLTVMKNALMKSGAREAIEVYRAARLNRIQADAAMLGPLIHDLTSLRFRNLDAMLDKALELFANLDRESPLPDGDEKRSDETIIYNRLLRSLAASSNTTKYIPIALELLDEMRRRNVNMDAMSITSIVIMLIRSASNFDEAAEAYRLVTGSNKNLLDHKGYIAVFNSVCDLEFRDPNSTDIYGRSHLMLPPPSLYYQIIQDMQGLGYPKTVEMYTTLLYRHGILATRVRNIKDPKRRGEGLTTMLDVIEATHREVNADPDIKMPDGHIQNALLDAYNRVGSMTRVLEVWSLQVVSRKVDNASVSIILDAIGHNRAHDKFDVIYNQLIESKFMWNRRNYNALLECLCRLGRLDSAMNFALKNMAEHDDTKMRPDVETLKVLTTFGMQSNRGKEVIKQLKTRLPELFQKLLQDKDFAMTDEARNVFAQV